MVELKETLNEILEYLSKLRGECVCLAYSGGMDSTLLAHLLTLSGVKFKAYMVVNDFISKSRVKDAKRMAEKLGFNLTVLKVEALPEMLENDELRCYYCKRQMFSKISEVCMGRILDGTNASDLKKHRPGLKALKEFNVLSPLAELRISKAEVRKLSEFTGLEQIPSDSCLATRIEGKITKEKLEFVDTAERVAWRILKGRGLKIEKLRVKTNKSFRIEVFFSDNS